MEHHSSTEVTCPQCGGQNWFTTITGHTMCGDCTVIMELDTREDADGTDRHPQG